MDALVPRPVEISKEEADGVLGESDAVSIDATCECCARGEPCALYWLLLRCAIENARLALRRRTG